MTGKENKMRFNRMKDIATYLMEVAEDTGYSYEFLCDRVSECIRDGESYNQAVAFVSGVSYEKDW